MDFWENLFDWNPLYRLLDYSEVNMAFAAMLVLGGVMVVAIITRRRWITGVLFMNGGAAAMYYITFKSLEHGGTLQRETVVADLAVTGVIVVIDLIGAFGGIPGREIMSRDDNGDLVLVRDRSWALRLFRLSSYLLMVGVLLTLATVPTYQSWSWLYWNVNQPLWLVNLALTYTTIATGIAYGIIVIERRVTMARERQLDGATTDTVRGTSYDKGQLGGSVDNTSIRSSLTAGYETEQ